MLKRLLSYPMFLIVLAGSVPAQAQDTDERKPLRIDTNHSTLGFSVPIVGGLSKVTGKFTEFDVQLFWDGADLANSSVRTTIQVTSIDTGIEDRDNDLRGSSFFEIVTHPTLTFESDHFEQQDEGYLAHGTLTMKGVSKEVALPFQVVKREKPGGGEWLAFTIAYTLDRTEYGIEWEHSIVPFFVGNDVEVNLFILTR